MLESLDEVERLCRDALEDRRAEDSARAATASPARRHA
jgi:hypothetical protein